MAVVFACFSTGDNAQAADQVKMAQIWEFTHSIRTPFVIAADVIMEPDQLWETGWVQSLGQKANIVVPEVEHTCNAGPGRVIDFAFVSDSVQPFWQGITPEYNSLCIGICLQFSAIPTQVRVRQACFSKNFAFPNTVEEVVRSRKRMKSMTKPEEGRALGFSHLQGECKTRSGHPKLVSQSIGFSATRNEACGSGIRFQEFMRTAEERAAEAHGQADHERAGFWW